MGLSKNKKKNGSLDRWLRIVFQRRIFVVRLFSLFFKKQYKFETCERVGVGARRRQRDLEFRDGANKNLSLSLSWLFDLWAHFFLHADECDLCPRRKVVDVSLLSRPSPSPTRFAFLSWRTPLHPTYRKHCETVREKSSEIIPHVQPLEPFAFASSYKFTLLSFIVPCHFFFFASIAILLTLPINIFAAIVFDIKTYERIFTKFSVIRKKKKKSSYIILTYTFFSYLLNYLWCNRSIKSH